MSIKISNLKWIENEFKNYLEAYFEKQSEKYSEAINQYKNNEKGLVGFSGENSVVRFSVIINPENNSFIFEEKDKYKENQTKNYKIAKEEIAKFIENLKFNMNNYVYNLDRDKDLNTDDINIISLIENIERTEQVIDFDNDLISLDFQNTKNYKIDKDNPIITTANLFSSIDTLQEVSLNDLKGIFSEMISRNETVVRFNQSILETASNVYIDKDNTIEEDNNISNRQDFGFNPKPSF